MNFPFPYAKPYKVQQDFMENLYETIEKKKIGLFESPTGTGKSLSLICGAMKWLKEYREKSKNELVGERMKEYLKSEIINPKDPKWLIEQKRNRVRKKILQEITSLEERKNERQKLIDYSREIGGDLLPKKMRSMSANQVSNDPSGSEFLLDEYQSDLESAEKRKRTYTQLPHDIDLCRAMNDLNAPIDDYGPKIIYASRTHSQISQFVGEIKKTVYCKEKVVTLGSRKNMCINSKVSRLSSLPQINDECLDLQKKKEHSCEFKRSGEEETQIMDSFAIHLQASIKDIEEIVEMGQKMHTCPYYGSRAAVTDSDVICLPYNLLLQKSSREACQISLKNSIVIIDEAHNVVDTINSIHSISINNNQLKLCFGQLNRYYEKYKAKLAAKNSLYIKQIILIVKKLIDIDTCKEIVPGMHGIGSFVNLLKIEHVNLFKIIRFIDESKLANKLQGFTEKVIFKDNVPGITDGKVILKHESPLRQINALFNTLAYPDSDGRILYSKDENGFTVKYLLLNPSNVFKEIIDESLSVILAGGTMSPIKDFIVQLFPDTRAENIHHFQCGHVIPSKNLLPIVVSKGISGKTFNFGFKNRNNIDMINDAGYSIMNICTAVPGGIVVFFPSYAYLDNVLSVWKKSDIYNKINSKKVVFVESNVSGDEVLGQYSTAATKPQPNTNGAILFSIVGGKLSEGINFSDDLGRAVIMIGLPYPNKQSTELQEKMKYLDSQKNGLSGSEYYENICMKAVNQCIGRAIRHEKDYSSIILFDERYNHDRIMCKLPKWITNVGVLKPQTFSEVLTRVQRFFSEKH